MKKTKWIRAAAVLFSLALALVMIGVPNHAFAAAGDSSISLPAGADANLKMGETLVLSGAVEGATNATYAWSITSGSSVTLPATTTTKDITITAASVGDTTIQLAGTDTDTSTTTTTSIVISVLAFSISPASISIMPGSSTSLTPENYTGTVGWVSVPTSVATVNSSGAVTAVSGGVATITATNTVGSVTQTDTTTVYVPTLTLNPASQTITAASTSTALTLTITNGGSLIADGATVSWTSTNGTIGSLSGATSSVSGGAASINFISNASATNGTTTITATVAGISRTATVTVSTVRHLEIVGPTDLNKTTRTGTYTVYLKNPDGTVNNDSTSTVHWSWSSSYLSLTSDSINSSRAAMHNGEAHIQLYAKYNTPSGGTMLYAWINSDTGGKVYHTIYITGLSSLPQTGQDMTLVYLFGGLSAALLVAAGVWYGIRKKHSVV